MGHLTREPESRVVPSGKSVCQFSVAVNHKYKSENGSVNEEVSFFDVETWGNVADNCQKYLGKGSLVLIEARLKQESWEDKATGAKRSKVKLVASAVHFLTRKEDSAGLFSGDAPTKS